MAWCVYACGIFEKKSLALTMYIFSHFIPAKSPYDAETCTDKLIHNKPNISEPRKSIAELNT